MSDSDKLRLNELQRFRKTSTRLALEAHSHCEVPAGCGGVVLRWRRAGAPIGLSFSKFVAGTADDFCIDGRPLDEQRTEVEPGEHVLSFVVARPGTEGFILLKVTLHPEIVTARSPMAVSMADGRWRASLTLPPDAWRTTEFDDAGFVALVEKAVPQPDDNRKWSWELLQEDAKGLGLPASSIPKAGGLLAWRRPPIERVWVRWTFRVDHEGFA
jgi:hypothetical protein